jgi:hypothetical protein
MRILVTEFISLDGVVQAPGGRNEDTGGGFRHGGWSMKYFDPEVMGRIFDELAQKSERLLQGRHTYQVSAQAWPQRSGDAFSDWINRVQKYVVSDTLSEGDITWKPTTIIRGADLLRTVSELRQRPGDTSTSTAAERWCAPFSPLTSWMSFSSPSSPSCSGVIHIQKKQGCCDLRSQQPLSRDDR